MDRDHERQGLLGTPTGEWHDDGWASRGQKWTGEVQPSTTDVLCEQTTPAPAPSDPHSPRHIPIAAIHKFTLIQLVCLIALWIVKSSKLDIIFPLMIAAPVPVYMLVARYFEPHHAALLATEDQEEVIAMHGI